jgi:hypothetical protein
MIAIPKPTKEPKKKKAKKKTERQLLIINCDDLWSDCVVARDKVCRYTGDDTYLSAHHIRNRAHWATRWLLGNGLTLSWRKVHFLQKANPERFQDMIIEIIGQEYYDEMKKKSLIVVDYTITDLLEIKEYLKKQLIIIKAGMDFNNLPF